VIGPVEAVAPGTLRDEVVFADRPARGMYGSGLLVLNPPYGAQGALAGAREACAAAYAPPDAEAAQVA
jgi:23S rRNA A2030 N6-methylase RlmJ